MGEASESPRGPLARFLHHEAASSVVLLIATTIALAWANSPWVDGYEHLLHTKVGLWWGDFHFALSLQHWVNDALMAIFFFVVGMEIKYEVLKGELANPRRLAMPLINRPLRTNANATSLDEGSAPS